MNAVNVTLNTLGTGLVALGVTSLVAGFNWGGVVEVVIGIACFVVYELTPAPTPVVAPVTPPQA